METRDELFKKPLYVFDLPHEVLSTLELDVEDGPSPEGISQAPTSSRRDASPSETESDSAAKACSTCHAAFQDTAEQRRHVKSDWHRYNLKQSLRGQKPVDEPTFDRLIGELDESLSGSDSESSDDEQESNSNDAMLSRLLKRQAKMHESMKWDDEPSQPQRRGKGSPFIWFRSPRLPAKHHLGVYKALFTRAETEKSDLVKCLAEKQLEPRDARQLAKQSGLDNSSVEKEPQIFLCMIGGGHFAAMIVSLTPKMEKRGQVTERQAIVIAHKTFHRYTTRRKQGGSQSANDAAKGAANSAGAQIRRANEIALEGEVRSLLDAWEGMISKCQLLFVRATGQNNRRTLFGPLRSQDPRLRTFPFSTRRATQSELMRAFVELTRAKLEEIEEKVTAEKAEDSASKTAPAPQKIPEKPSKEEEEALLHTSQLQALIKRSKVPALVKYFSGNSISPNFRFHPPSSTLHRHSSTPLHFASSIHSPLMVFTLLTKIGADPTVHNVEGKVPFDLAGDRQTRDAFRVARSELGEQKWSWEDAHCPPAITKAEAEAREQSQQAEAKTQEAERRRTELERLEKANANNDGSSKSLAAKKVSALEVTAADRREQESRGLTPEQKQKLERERRARAAEERMKKMAAGGQ